MTAPSNANTSGLEVVAWMYGYTHDQTRQLTLFEGQATDKTGWHQPLVTAASAQARIAELEKALERQAHNMAFLLNHAPIVQHWYEKFSTELADDRAALQQETQK